MFNKPSQPDSSKMEALQKLKELAMELMGEKIKGKMPAALDLKVAMIKPHGLTDPSEALEDPKEEASESPSEEKQEDSLELPDEAGSNQESDLEKLKKLLKK